MMVRTVRVIEIKIERRTNASARGLSRHSSHVANQLATTFHKKPLKIKTISRWQSLQKRFTEQSQIWIRLQDIEKSIAESFLETQDLLFFRWIYHYEPIDGRVRRCPPARQAMLQSRCLPDGSGFPKSHDNSAP